MTSLSPRSSRRGLRHALVLCVLASACSGGGSLVTVDSLEGGTSRDSGGTSHEAGTHQEGGRDAAPIGRDAGADGAATKPDAMSGADGATSHPADGSSDSSVDGGLDAASDAPPRDHGEASTTYPAFLPDLPHVVANGGAVLAAPQVVTVTWPNEANLDEFEQFGDLVGTGAYWASTTSEYGVGKAVSGASNHVHVTDLPLATMSSTDVANFVIDHVTNYAASGWPAPTGNSFYILYLSAQTDLTFGTSNACSAAGGYHDTVTVNGVDTVYAVIPHCEASGASETLAASHELIEGSTDPHPDDLPAYLGFDTAHLAWDIWGSFQDELGDACEFYPTSFIQSAFVDDGGMATFGVQRTWSNANAALGHDPCQPASTVPYYNVAPIGLETISLSLSGEEENGTVQTNGYNVPVGATKTFALGLYSDGPTGGPWSLSASENGAEGPLGPSNLTLSLDRTSGQNGDIAYLTVTVNSVNPQLGGEFVAIASQLGTGPIRYLPILISSH